MITGVFGLTGSGKSTFLAYCAQRALHGKKISIRGVSVQDHVKYDRVYSNYYINGCYQLDYNCLGKFNFENCLILIDEIMMYSDSRNYKNFSEELKYFYSHHRKYNIDVIYCSQSFSDCDIKIRNLTKHLLYCRRFGSFTLISPIRKQFGISNSQISETFELAPLISTKVLWGRRYFKYFDTMDGRRKFPEPQLELW